ncbi:phosphopantetheine-binding protein [Streptomyces thinghirensis]|nr:phosphopantetheine-binding protein [Streptomyces thinghirensis]
MNSASKQASWTKDTSYADYGADSILLAQVLQRIRRRLDVPRDPSVLLEYPTLSELVTWLLDTHPAEVAARSASATEAGQDQEPGRAPARPEPAPPVAALSPPAAASVRTEPRCRGRGSRTARGGHRVAGVGMACRLPGAPGLDAYWGLLSQGRRAVREVPAERWGRADRLPRRTRRRRCTGSTPGTSCSTPRTSRHGPAGPSSCWRRASRPCTRRLPGGRPGGLAHRRVRGRPQR